MKSMRSEACAILNKGTVIPAIPLALDENRKFDEKRQRTLVRYYLHAGAGGIAVAVHTTQFEIRSPEVNLFYAVVKTVLDEIARFEKKNNKAIIKIVGICGKTEQAVSEARFALESGADAALLSPGGLKDLSEDEMIERTKIIAEIMPVIGFYLQPAAGGRIFSADYWKRLADIDGVAAIKCAPFNRYQTIELVRGVALSERRDEIALYTGNDDNILIDLLTKYEFNISGKKIEKRFVGGLLGHWAVWTKTVADLFEKIREYRNEKDIPAELLALSVKITDANAAFFDAANKYAGCIPGIHEVLRRQGIFEGIWCINPGETLSPGQAAEIDRVYIDYPELNDDSFIKQHLHEWQEEL
ncbi:MAG: dihydrodipicolinate synthase family protein [Oscillospiraceae bacterium]|nr:dihydrodipicolinate synthase family protein [Oscillospiraceae bacterium]